MATAYNLNSILTIAQNLQYRDEDGLLVAKTFPIEYIVLIGRVFSNYITTINSNTSSLEQYGERITALEARTIPDAYTTPEIDGGCIYSGTKAIDELLGDFITAYCNYIGVVGTQANHAAFVSGFPVTGTDDAYAGGTMSGISGWVSSPTKTSEVLKNIGLTLADIRTGLTQVRTWAVPSCKDFVLDFQAVKSTTSGEITIYFGSYSYFPEGWTDGGSGLVIEDAAGNTKPISVDITDPTPVVVDLSTSSLSPVSNYTVTVEGMITCPDPSFTCTKVVTKTVVNNTTGCPTLAIGEITSTGLTFSFTPFVKAGVYYIVNVYSNDVVVSSSSTYTNPTSTVIGTISGLTTATTYTIGITSVVDNSGTFVCSKTEFTTL